MNHANIGSDVLLTSEVARVLGMSAQTVRLWARLGRLRASKTTGGVRLFERRDVEEALRKRTTRRVGGAR